MSINSIEVAQIAAISRNRCIGKGNDLPWHIPTDLQHFKQLTTQNSDDTIKGIVIMGRKTFESMGSKPLPKRVSFIITTQLDYAEQQGLIEKKNARVVHDLDVALQQAAALAAELQLKTIWVIGGERVFSEALSVTDRIELTHVNTDINEGDAFYPELPSEFAVAAESEHIQDEKSGLDYKFVTYKRKA